MEKEYYYFATSLSTLEFGAKPPVSYKNFMDDCKRLLLKKDYDLIKKARFDNESPPMGINKLFDDWISFHLSCCNESARFRSDRSGKDPLDYMRGQCPSYEPFIAQCVAQAAKNPDLLEAEKFLDQMKWKKLDELTQGHYFDIEFLIVYALKLQMLERYQIVESGKGKDIFNSYKEFYQLKESSAFAENN